MGSYIIIVLSGGETLKPIKEKREIYPLDRKNIRRNKIWK